MRREMQHGTPASTPTPTADLTLVLAYCGLRIGEARSLRWRDLKDKTITVRFSTPKVDGMGYVEGPTKTHRTRWVPVPAAVWERLTRSPTPDVVEALKTDHRELMVWHVKSRGISRHEREMLDHGYQLAIEAVNSLPDTAALRAEVTPDALVFPGKHGDFMKDARYRAVFDKAAAAIGVKGLTPHELRHTCASLSIQAGANVKAVQRLLGHATASMTLDLYGHLFDDDLVAVADALDKAMCNCGITAVSG